MLAATDNFLYLKVSLKLMLWSHMPVCYYKFDITHESVFSSPSLLNEYLRYDKLWGPSQRVVTLLQMEDSKKRIQVLSKIKKIEEMPEKYIKVIHII